MCESVNSVDYRNWFPTVTNTVILYFWHGWGNGFTTSKSFEFLSFVPLSRSKMDSSIGAHTSQSNSGLESASGWLVAACHSLFFPFINGLMPMSLLLISKVCTRVFVSRVWDISYFLLLHLPASFHSIINLFSCGLANIYRPRCVFVHSKIYLSDEECRLELKVIFFCWHWMYLTVKVHGKECFHINVGRVVMN